MIRRTFGTLVGLAFVTLGTAASAHVSFEMKKAKVGGAYKAVLNVPHGCEGAATTEVSVDIPEGVIGVKPMPKPGWTLSLKKGPYERSYAFYHGETKSDGVKQVTWSGGQLPDEYFDQFVLSTFIAGELASGGNLAFPVTQKCENGELRWDEVASPGQDAHSLAHPAPLLQLVAGDGDDHAHHHNEAPAAGAAPISIEAPWTRPASAGGMGVGYVKITNKGSEADTLLGATSDAAERVELHETTISADGVASMKKIDTAEIAPGKSIELKPGGMHLMLIGLKAPIKEGDAVKAKLNFKNGGPVDVEFMAGAGAPGAGGEHEHHHH
ncbi:MAG: DUF1775 domain-containing protein [Hyphomicrobium sp.]